MIAQYIVLYSCLYYIVLVVTYFNNILVVSKYPVINGSTNVEVLKLSE